jgi:hypothetical protein
MTRLDDCTPTPDEQARYTTPDAEREVQIRQRTTEAYAFTCSDSGISNARLDRVELLRLLDEARAEIARLRAPLAADVMELARNAYWEHEDGDGARIMPSDQRHPIFAVQAIARALTTYGDQRAREGAMRAAIRNYNDADEEIIRAKREARAAAIEEAAQVADNLAPLRSIYKNVGASIRALAAGRGEPTPTS